MSVFASMQIEMIEVETDFSGKGIPLGIPCIVKEKWDSCIYA